MKQLDILSDSRASAGVEPRAITVGGHNADVDMAGYNWAVFLVPYTVTGGDELTVTIYDSEDNSTFTAVSGKAETIDGDPGSGLYAVHVKASSVKRYVRCNLLGSGNPPAACGVLRGGKAISLASSLYDMEV
jgi:hypothetical protein